MKVKGILILSIMFLALSGCGVGVEKTSNSDGTAVSVIGGADGSTSIFVAGKLGDEDDDAKEREIVNPEGNTLSTRIHEPEGYSRVIYEEEPYAGFSEYLREYPLKKDGADVYLYNRNKKGFQSGHVAVFDLPIEEYDLQQCADSILRIYAEYYWARGEYEKISFHLTNGFLMEYTKWIQGNRIEVDGNNVSWVKTKGFDDSYECFTEYLLTLFTYAGTISMEAESGPIELSEIKVGDIFIRGASPGHVVMIMDVCENEAGEKAFLLAQGYMPAQDFHLLKNPLHKDDPWYYESEIEYPFKTPEYTFDEGSLKRPGYL